MAWRLDEKYTPDYPFIAGHRGFSACYPENSMIAFVEAAKLGVDMMEIDIAVSKDGVLVLYHDKTLEAKSTPLTGRVEDYTYEELKQVRIGAKLGMEDQPLITLEEFCQKFLEYPDMIINVDLKQIDNMDHIFAVIDMLEKYGYLHRCVFNSENGKVSRYFHENTDYFLIGPPDDYPYAINQYPGIELDIDAPCVPPRLLTEELAEKVHKRGKILISCCIKDEATVDLSIQRGCRIALCDDPRPMLKRAGRL